MKRKHRVLFTRIVSVILLIMLLASIFELGLLMRR